MLHNKCEGSGGRGLHVEPQVLLDFMPFLCSSVSWTLTYECLIKFEKREQLRKQGLITSYQQQTFSYWSKETLQTSSSSSPYCVMKAMQLSTMMGISFLLSCCSLRVFPLPPAARWMSEYHREKSVRPTPCRCRVLTEGGNQMMKNEWNQI